MVTVGFAPEPPYVKFVTRFAIPVALTVRLPGSVLELLTVRVTVTELSWLTNVVKGLPGGVITTSLVEELVWTATVGVVERLRLQDPIAGVSEEIGPGRWKTCW